MSPTATPPGLIFSPDYGSRDAEEIHSEDMGSLSPTVQAASVDSDPFCPFDDMPADASNIVTIRAVLVGGVCGALINASNIYIGLRVGWTSSANILGAIIGFAVLKRWARNSRLPFGPGENNIVQVVATAAGGMSSVFVSAIPALYQLGLLQTPPKDFFRIVVLTAVGGYFGLLSAVPLRRFFIEHVARELNLVFPSSMATAITIRSMHLAADGEKVTKRKLKVTVIAFLCAMTLRVVSRFAVGILWDWHIFTWLVNANIGSQWAVAAESWGFFIEWSPAMLGSGMLVDFKVAASFFAGSVLAWGIIGPYLVSQGMAFGEKIATGSPLWAELTSYTSMSVKFASAAHPSPRYWLLWPGVACTLAVAFVELACQWRIFWNLCRAIFKAIASSVEQFTGKSSHRYVALEDEGEGEEVEDLNRTIPTWMWAPGLVALVVMAVAAMKVQFDMSALETLLALLLAFSMSLVAIQATGATDTTPLNGISKVSQVLLAGATRSAEGGVAASQRLSLIGAGLTNIGASQACDLMGDFRVGYLLRTPPRLQYAAQLVGTLIATFIAPAVFVLFTSAYPCIIAQPGESQESCEFPSPAAAAWRAVAIAASEPTLPVPDSSYHFAIAMAAFGSLLVLLRHFLSSTRFHYLGNYLPNMMILALPFTLPSPVTGITMMTGALLAKLWRSKRPEEFEQYIFGVAAGLVAGEGIGGTINCALSLMGIGEQWSTGTGCPAGTC